MPSPMEDLVARQAAKALANFFTMGAAAPFIAAIDAKEQVERDQAAQAAIDAARAEADAAQALLDGARAAVAGAPAAGVGSPFPSAGGVPSVVEGRRVPAGAQWGDVIGDEETGETFLLWPDGVPLPWESQEVEVPDAWVRDVAKLPVEQRAEALRGALADTGASHFRNRGDVQGPGWENSSANPGSIYARRQGTLVPYSPPVPGAAPAVPGAPPAGGSPVPGAPPAGGGYFNR